MSVISRLLLVGAAGSCLANMDRAVAQSTTLCALLAPVQRAQSNQLLPQNYGGTFSDAGTARMPGCTLVAGLESPLVLDAATCNGSNVITETF